MNLSTTKCQSFLRKLDGMIRKATTFESWSFDEGYETTYCIKAKVKNGTKAWVIRTREDDELDYHIEIELFETTFGEETLLMLYRDNGTWNMDPKFQPKLEKVFKAFGV